MLSIIVTAYKEAKSIGKALESILNTEYSGLNSGYELITVIPDQETYEAAKKVITEFPKVKWVHITDPGKGKPHALNLAFTKAKGEILFLTDGDVYLGKQAIPRLLMKFKDEKVGGVTGRPVATNKKNHLLGYYAHLLADAANHKRLLTMSDDASGHSLKIVSRTPRFFVMSGYIMALRNLKIRVPEDCLIEDAYLSYELFNKGYDLRYEPEALVYVKYPINFGDWFRQKLRSVGGYVQLWKYHVIKPQTKVRTFWKELEYFWFPFKYARNLLELIWSLLLYPIRLYLWLVIFWERRVLNKSFADTWVRVESTK